MYSKRFSYKGAKEAAIYWMKEKGFTLVRLVEKRDPDCIIDEGSFDGNWPDLQALVQASKEKGDA